MGSVDADLLVSSKQLGITLLGPCMPDRSWQAKAGKGLDLAHFSIDWTTQQATCPQGQQMSRLSQAGAHMEIVFAAETCAGYCICARKPSGNLTSPTPAGADP